MRTGSVEQTVGAKRNSLIWGVELGHQSEETEGRLTTWSPKDRRVVKESAIFST